jgi:hypothetical protein
MSYWCAEQLVVRVAGPEGEREVVLEQPFALVGTHARADVVLEAPGVHKRALLLVAMERGIYCVHLDVEQAASDVPGRWLVNDDSIELGPFRLTARVASGEPLAQPEWNPQRARSAPPIPVLHVFLDGILKDRRRVRHPLVLVGRRPQCSLRLLGQVVSSFHCLLYWCDQRLWCIDLASSNGTRLNDELFACREVVFGERLEVGEFDLLYYRWSPRQSTPGFALQTAGGAVQELDSAFDMSLDAAAELDDEGSLLGTSLDTIEAARAMVQEPQRGEVAERMAEIERQRAAMERERLVAAQELQRRTDALSAEAAALAAERDALAEERRNWEADRMALAQEMEREREELRGLKKAALAAREEAEHKKAAAAASKPEAPRGDEDAAEVGVQIGKWLQSAAATPAGGVHDDLKTASRYENQPAAQPMAVEHSAQGAVAASVGRRKAANQEELTSFVSGRLSDIEDGRRRRMLLVWTAITVTAVATAAAGAGIWFWLH